MSSERSVYRIKDGKIGADIQETSGFGFVQHTKNVERLVAFE